MPATRHHVPVLIVGGGYAGLAASLFLADAGVETLLVDRGAPVSIQGRARGINQRTMEIYRPYGIEHDVLSTGEPFADDAGVARCHTLSGEWEWLLDPEPDPRGARLSPARFCMADQNSVEPILQCAARRRGAVQWHRSELLNLQARSDGVHATIRRADSDELSTISADYLIAADGHRSTIRDQVGITRTGPGTTQNWLSVVFDADLSALTPRRALFWIILNQTLGFASLVTTATPQRWSLGITYDPAVSPLSSFTQERLVDVVHAALGRVDTPVTIVDATPWEQAVAVADTYRAGRVFLVGDSAHVWPPAGAMGANSAVQDARNLAWKLAAVIGGYADDPLLDSYEVERRPVAVALADLTVRRQAARFGGGLDDDIDDLVCTLGQRYRSDAILADIAEVPFHGAVAATAQPGARLPHAWIERDGERLSTLDLARDGFMLLTCVEGAGWLAAADAVAARDRVPIHAYRIGAGGTGAELVDLDDAWPGVTAEVASTAAILVRPDGYVAALLDPGEAGAERTLAHALSGVMRPHRSASDALDNRI